MEKIYDRQSFLEIEKKTINKYGIRGELLMEQAAQRLSDHTENLCKDKYSKIFFICGKGNNGGDAVVSARNMLCNGYKKTTVIQIIDEKTESRFVSRTSETGVLGLDDGSFSDELTNAINSYVSAGGKLVQFFESQKRYLSDIIDGGILVDGLFGIGLNKSISGFYANIVNEINHMRSRREIDLVIAVDIPSGINSDNGELMGTAVKADETVTFGSKKLGHVSYPGREYSGRLTVYPVSFVYDEFNGSGEWLSEERPETEKILAGCLIDDGSIVGSMLIPDRPLDSNKGTYGKLMCITGSRYMPGAAVISAKAAYNTGTGMVIIDSTEETLELMIKELPEAVFSGNGKRFPVSGCSAVIIGPGISTEDESKSRLQEFLESGFVGRYVIDADAINIIAGIMDKMGLNDTLKRIEYINGNFTENVVFTPHKKELSRLLNITMKELENLKKISDVLRKESNPVFVLKDAATLVVTKGRGYINQSGNNGMSTAGSGDVLAGIIGGLMAQGFRAYDAAVMGTFIHGVAGDIAACKKGKRSILASDILNEVPLAVRFVLK